MNTPDARPLHAPQPDQSLPLVEERRLHELVETMEAAQGGILLHEVLAMYKVETHPRLARLIAAWISGDAEEARAEAHFLAGSSANLGFKRLAAWLRDLEDCAKQGQFPVYPGLEASLEAEWTQACAACETLLARFDGAP
jgi:HPt (histidine-containing phosphotransfer) domain-containing protein